MTDWPAILADLRKQGITHAQIGSICGRHQRTIDNYSQGTSEPPHSVGEIILKMHRAYCQRKTDGHAQTS